jgi:hypothetical protein
MKTATITTGATHGGELFTPTMHRLCKRFLTVMSCPECTNGSAKKIG